MSWKSTFSWLAGHQRYVLPKRHDTVTLQLIPSWVYLGMRKSCISMWFSLNVPYNFNTKIKNSFVYIYICVCVWCMSVAKSNKALCYGCSLKIMNFLSVKSCNLIEFAKIIYVFSTESSSDTQMWRNQIINRRGWIAATCSNSISRSAGVNCK